MAARLANPITSMTTCITGVSCNHLKVRYTAIWAMMEITDTMPMILQLSLPENVLPLIFLSLICSKITKT